MKIALALVLGLAISAQTPEFDETPPVRFEAVVHQVNAHHAILGVKVDPKRIDELLAIGYKKVGRMEDVDHRTIYDGRVWATRVAVDPEVFARFKPGATIQCEARRTYEGTMVVINAR